MVWYRPGIRCSARHKLFVLRFFERRHSNLICDRIDARLAIRIRRIGQRLLRFKNGSFSPPHNTQRQNRNQHKLPRIPHHYANASHTPYLACPDHPLDLYRSSQAYRTDSKSSQIFVSGDRAKPQILQKITSVNVVSEFVVMTYR